MNEADTTVYDPLREPFTLSGIVYRPDEVNQASWLVYREETAGGVILAAYCLAFGLTGVWAMFFGSKYALPLLFALFGSGVTPFIAPVAVGAVIFIPLLISFWIWDLLKGQRLDTFKKDPRFRLPVSYTIASAGFQILWPHATVLSPWPKVTNCIETPDSLCLVTDGLIFPLPKRCFISAQQFVIVRRLVIASGVHYSRAGKEKGEIIYAAAPDPVAIKLTLDSPIVETADVGQASEVGPAAEDDLRSLVWPEVTEDPLYGTLVHKHSSSNLISEPMVWQKDKQVLYVECNYTLTELRSADRLMFCKYGLPKLGLIYIGLVFYVALFPAALVTLATAVPEFGIALIPNCLKCTPFLLPGFGFHIWYVMDKRLENIRDMIKFDQPILLEISETDCRMRTRRAYFIYQWQLFLGCLSTKDHFICPLKIGSVIIPKRLLKDRMEAAFVENLLRKNIRGYQEWS